ncbi:hypothetical protein AB6A40_009723 [Gnathostoma spinigerum]|uniref:Uncharacterized protein n=1 Tax=Gnathostoma spinigerum TaxID=75299 RepID=A0ABD6F042_9BILA
MPTSTTEGNAKDNHRLRDRADVSEITTIREETYVEERESRMEVGDRDQGEYYYIHSRAHSPSQNRRPLKDSMTTPSSNRQQSTVHTFCKIVFLKFILNFKELLKFTGDHRTTCTKVKHSSNIENTKI